MVEVGVLIRGLLQPTGGGGGFGVTLWCVLVCSWRHQLPDCLWGRVILGKWLGGLVDAWVSPHLHALSDPGAGDLVVVWGPGGQWDTANRPEKGDPGEGREVPWGPTPHHPRCSMRRYQFPTPLVSPVRLRAGKQFTLILLLVV